MFLRRQDIPGLTSDQGCFQRIARSAYFENFTMVVIVVYAIYMSVDTDWNTADIITETHPFFIVCEQAIVWTACQCGCFALSGETTQSIACICRRCAGYIMRSVEFHLNQACVNQLSNEKKKANLKTTYMGLLARKHRIEMVERETETDTD